MSEEIQKTHIQDDKIPSNKLLKQGQHQGLVQAKQEQEKVRQWQ